MGNTEDMEAQSEPKEESDDDVDSEEYERARKEAEEE